MFGQICRIYVLQQSSKRKLPPPALILHRLQCQWSIPQLAKASVVTSILCTTLQGQRCDRQHLVKILAAWLKATIKRDKKGTNSIFVMTHNEVKCIPKNQTVTYARVVINFRPQKADQHCIQITAGGNLINYPGILSTSTADLTTSKLMWNSVISTVGAK